MFSILKVEKEEIESKKRKERRSKKKTKIEGENEGEEVKKERCKKDDDDGRDKEDGKSKNDEEKMETKLEPINIPPVNNVSAADCSEMAEKHLEYRNLFAKWVPLPLHMVPIESIIEDEEEDWLCKKKNDIQSRKETTTRDTNHSSNGIGIIYQGIQPRAHYLPDANINALPYVVPL